MKYPLLPLLFFIGSFSSEISAQWHPVEAPVEYVNVTGYHKFDSLEVAISSCGLFGRTKSSDPWERIAYGNAKDVVLKDDTLYAVGNHFLKAIDMKDPAYPSLSFSIWNGNWITEKDSLLFIAGNNQLFVSSDGGDSLSPYINGLPNHQGAVVQPTDIEFTPSYIFLSTYAGLYRSDYTYSGWQPLVNGINTGEVAFVENIDDTLYASIDDTIFRSWDDGNSWIQFSVAPTYVKSLAKAHGNFYLLCYQGVYRSTDNGTHWDPFHTGLPANGLTFLREVDGEIIGGGSGLYKVNGNQWQKESVVGLGCTFGMDVMRVNKKLVYGGRSGIFLRRQDGSWKNISPSGSYQVRHSNLISHANTLWLMMYNQAAPGNTCANTLVMSNDYGTTWDTVLSGVHITSRYDDQIPILRSFGNEVYVGLSDTLMKTGDMGQTWVGLEPPNRNTNCSDINDVVLFKAKLYVSNCRASKILEYDNTQKSWFYVNVPGVGEVRSFAVHDSVLFVDGSTSIKATGDLSKGWNAADSGLVSDNVMDYISSDTAVFVAQSRQVAYSTDYGREWTDISAGIPGQSRIQGMTMFDDSLYIVTEKHGIFKHYLHPGDVSVPESQPMVHDEVMVYPNPSAGYFYVKLASEVPAFYRLLNASGKLVRSAALEPEKPVSTADLPAGIYSLEVMVENQVFRTKILVK